MNQLSLSLIYFGVDSSNPYDSRACWVSVNVEIGSITREEVDFSGHGLLQSIESR